MAGGRPAADPHARAVHPPAGARLHAARPSGRAGGPRVNEADARRLTTVDPRDLLLALRRRPAWLLGGLGAGLLLGLLAQSLVPPVYRSEAMLLVESRWFPQDFLQNPLGKSMRDRLQTLQHRLTSDQTLQSVAEQVGAERLGGFVSV